MTIEFELKATIFIPKYGFENVVCKMMAIVSMTKYQRGNGTYPRVSHFGTRERRTPFPSIPCTVYAEIHSDLCSRIWHDKPTDPLTHIVAVSGKVSWFTPSATWLLTQMGTQITSRDSAQSINNWRQAHQQLFMIYEDVLAYRINDPL